MLKKPNSLQASVQLPHSENQLPNFGYFTHTPEEIPTSSVYPQKPAALYEGGRLLTLFVDVICGANLPRNHPNPYAGRLLVMRNVLYDLLQKSDCGVMGIIHMLPTTGGCGILKSGVQAVRQAAEAVRQMPDSDILLDGTNEGFPATWHSATTGAHQPG